MDDALFGAEGSKKKWSGLSGLQYVTKGFVPLFFFFFLLSLFFNKARKFPLNLLEAPNEVILLYLRDLAQSGKFYSLDIK